MKKRNLNIFLVIVGIASLLVACFFVANSSKYSEEGSTGDAPAGYGVEFHDHGELTSYPSDYSNSAVVITENTKFILMEAPRYYSWATGLDMSGTAGYSSIPDSSATAGIAGKTNWYYWTGTEESPANNSFEITSEHTDYIGSVHLRNFRLNGGKLVYVITNCVPTSDGYLDVRITVDDVRVYDEYNTAAKEHSFVLIQHWDYIEYMKNQNNIDEGTYDVALGYGDPIYFDLESAGANTKFTLEYGKYSGSGNDYEGTFTKHTEFDKLSVLYFDIDIDYNHLWSTIHNRDYVHYLPGVTGDNYLFSEHEGYAPLSGNSIIYYNKDEAQPCYSDGRCLTLHQGSNIVDGYGSGLYVNNPPIESVPRDDNEYPGHIFPTDHVQTNGVYYQSATFNFVNNLSGSYSIRYGGSNCGIGFLFMSPVMFDTPAPVKRVLNEQSYYHIGDSFTYQVEQYVPNNYYGQSINLHQAFENLPAKTR